MPKRQTSKPRRKSRSRRPSRQVMEARTIGLTYLNKAAIGVLVVLICVAVAVSVMPEVRRLHELEAELVETKEKEFAVVNEKDQRQRELAALRNDSEYQDLKARDLLDLYMPGETVVRIRRER